MKPMADEFGWSRATIAGAIAFGSILGGLVGPFVGPMIDRHGPRLAAFWSILILSLGLVGISLVNRIWQLYVCFGVGRMVAVGMLALIVSTCVSNWFIRRRGRAMGIAWLGPFFGSVLLTLLAQYFISALGWRIAWVMVGLTMFLMSGIPSLIFLRQRPEDMGLLPDGDEISTNHLTGGHSAGEPKGIALISEQASWTRNQAIRTAPFWLLTAAWGLVQFVQAGMNFHIFPFLTDQGVRPVTAVIFLAVMQVSSAAGSVGWGFLAEKYRVNYMLASNVFLNGLAFFLVYQVGMLKISGSLGILILFIMATLNGLSYGGRNPLINTVWADYFGRRNLASIIGFSSPFRFTANAIGPVFAAFFYDIYGSYSFPFYFIVATFFATGIIFISTKAPQKS